MPNFLLSSGKPRSIPIFFIHFRIPVLMLQILSSIPGAFHSIQNFLVQIQIRSLSSGLPRYVPDFIAQCWIFCFTSGLPSLSSEFSTGFFHSIPECLAQFCINLISSNFSFISGFLFQCSRCSPQFRIPLAKFKIFLRSDPDLLAQFRIIEMVHPYVPDCPVVFRIALTQFQI